MAVEVDPTRAPDQQPKRPVEPSEEETKEVSKLRAISSEDLKYILKEHEKWYSSKKLELKLGKQADLSRTKLFDASLEEFEPI